MHLHILALSDQLCSHREGSGVSPPHSFTQALQAGKEIMPRNITPYYYILILFAPQKHWIILLLELINCVIMTIIIPVGKYPQPHAPPPPPAPIPQISQK